MEETKESSVVPFVERMFQLSDTDGDGFLSVEEFVDMLRVTNPDAELDESQMSLIVEHVWQDVAHLSSLDKGLGIDTLIGIYNSGIADVRRDYELVLAHAKKSTVERPVAPVSTIEGGEGSACENFNSSISFVVHTPDAMRRVEPDIVKRALVEKALPEGFLVDVGEPLETYPGRCFPVKCSYRDGTVSADELEYVKTVMEMEPHQVFSESVFGDGVAVSCMSSGDGGSIHGPRVVRDASLMGSAGFATFAFALEVDGDVDVMMKSLCRLLPREAAAMVTSVDSSDRNDARGKVVTVGVRLPTDMVKVCHSLVKTLKESPLVVCPEMKRAKLLAIEEPDERHSIVTYAFTSTDALSIEDGEVLATDLKSMLPRGSTTRVVRGCGEKSLTIVASIPREYKKREVDLYKDAPKTLKEWCRFAKSISKVDVGDGCTMFDCSHHTLGAFGIPLEEEFIIQQDDVPYHGIISPPKDALIAGYQRRSPSTSGTSSGLVEALDDVHIENEVASPGLADLSISDVNGKDSKHMSTVISIHAYPSSGGGLNEMDEQGCSPRNRQGGWRGFIRSLSPRKKEGGRRQEHLADAVVQLPMASPENDLQRQTGDAGDAEAREKLRLAAIMDANIKQIVGQAEFLVHAHPENLAKALGDVQRAAGLLPSWACHKACMDVAELLMKSSHFEEARPFLVQATKASPEDAIAYFRLGNTYFALNEFESAARHYYEAIKRCSTLDTDLLTKVHINMGIALESLGNLSAAEREYSKAANLADQHPRVHKLLGSIRSALGNYDGAIEALEQALRITPDFADAWTDLGCVRRVTGNTKEARRCFNMALASDEDNVEAHFNLGNILKESSKLEEAITHYDAVLKQDPDHSMALLGRAVSLSMLAGDSVDDPRRKEAAQCLRRCLESCQEDDVFTVEVKRLYELVKKNASSAQLRNQMSVIEDFVDDGVVPSSVGHEDEAGLAAHMNNPDPPPSKPTVSRTDSDTYSIGTSRSDVQNRRMSRSMSMASIQSGMHPTDRSYDRLSSWVPPTSVVESDFSPDLVGAIQTSLYQDPVQNIVATMDMPLLQSLQPFTVLTLEALKNELYGSQSAITSPSKRSRAIRKIHVDDLMQMLYRLIHPRSPPHLVSTALTTLQQRIFPMLDLQDSGYLNFGTIMAMLALLVDAPARERLGTAYRFLMSRSLGNATGENPITRADAVEFMVSLKVAFELPHNQRLLSQVIESNTGFQGSRFVMYEAFSKDVATYFSVFDILPLLCNPLQ